MIPVNEWMNEFIPITNGEVQDLYAGRNNKHMYM